MIYIISKDTFGDYNIRDIQSNSCWTGCALDGYAIIPDEMVEDILATKGFCDIVLNDDETEVVSFVARDIPDVPACVRDGFLKLSGGTMTGPLTLAWQNLTGFRALNGVRMGAFRFDRNTTCHIFNVKNKWSALVALTTNTHQCALYLLAGTSENSIHSIIKIAGTEQGTLGFSISNGIITVTCNTEWSNAWYITTSIYEDQVAG